MIPILYKETEKEFTSNGIGQLHETILSETTEVLNGEFELYLEYPSNGQWFDEIQEFRYIQVIPNNQDDEHAFRIYELDKTDDDDVVRVYATTKTNELGDNLIEKLKIKSSSPGQIYSSLKSSMILTSNYDFVTDLTTKGDVEWEFRSPLNCILGEEGSMIQIFGGEIKRTNDYIYHYKRRGKDRVTSVRQDKNLDGFKQTVSTKGLVTKILPYYSYYPTKPDGYVGPNEPKTIIAPIVASDKAKNYPQEVLRAVDFSPYSDEITATKLISDREVIDVEQTRKNLIKMSKTYFTSINKGVDEPKVSIDVDLYSLADSEEYSKLSSLEHIGIADTIDVWVPDYEIDVTVKVRKLIFDNLTEKVIALSAGSGSTSTYQSQKGEYTSIINSVQAYVDSALDNTVHMASNGSNRIWSGVTRPSEGVREGDIWFEPLQDGHTAMHRFDGVEWIFVMDTTDTTDNANRIEEAMKEIAKAQKAADDANKEINDAITNAGFDTLPEVIQNIQNIANQAKTDADAALKEASDISIDVKLDVAQAKTDALDALDKANIATNKAETSIANSTKALRDASSALSGVTGLETSMTEEFTRIDGVLTSKVSSTEHDALKGIVTSQGTLITQNKNSISSKAEKSSVDTLTGNVENQSTLIEQNANSIKTKANQSTVDTLSGRVSSAETSITQNADAIELKANTSTVNSLTGRISNAESTLSTHAGQISLKANQDTVDTLTGAVQSLGSEFDIVAGQISSKVWNTDIETAIDGIEVGGRNYIRNSKPNNIDFWGGMTGGTPYFEDGYIKGVVKGTGSARIRYLDSDRNNILTPGLYTLSYDYYSEVSADRAIIVDWRSASNPNSWHGLKTGWQRFEDVFEVTESIRFDIRWFINGEEIRLRNIKLEKGNKATDWTPAPEDTTQAISAVQSDVAQKFDSITSTVSSLDGRVSQNKQTLDGFTQTVSGIDERVSQNKQTIDGFTQTITGIDGRVSQNKQTIDGFTRTVSTLDGKVSTVQQTVNGLSTSVSNNSGDISTVQQTVRGLQTTVASKASQTQVTQLADGFKVFAGSINTVNMNLADRWVSQKINNDGTNVISNSSRATPVIKVPDNTTHLTVEDGTWGGWYNSAFFWYNSRQQFLGKYDLAANEDPGENIVTVEIPSNVKYFRYHTTPNMSKETKIEVGTEATGLFYDDSEIKSEISVLENNINLRVTKGELMSQINIEAGRTLIQSDKILLNATNTVITGTTWMDGAVMKTASMDGAVIKNATIGSAKIANLDANKISGNTANFVRANFNSSNNALTLSSTGIKSSGGIYSYELGSVGVAYIANGVQTGTLRSYSGTKYSGRDRGVALVARTGHEIHLGYGQGTSIGGTYTPAIAIDGTTGNVYMDNIHPRVTSSQGVRFDNGSVGNIQGVVIRNNNSLGAGIFFGNNGHVYYTNSAGSWTNLSKL